MYCKMINTKFLVTIFSIINLCGVGAERDTWIINYFHQGYTYFEITNFLLICHGISLSVRQLSRILKEHGLKRKNLPASPLLNICSAIVEELGGSGSCLGYKSLWRRLQQLYGLNVKRDAVRQLLRIIDPEGVELRSRRRLKRREYIVPGPNFLWHMDGYDKLKPFGFAIHGAIDGYSRKILWLRVASSNNNPRIIARYYLEALRRFKLVPTLLRADRGTENGTVGSLQKCLRYNHDDKLAGTKSYIEGKSTSNQRIESYWSQLRKHGADWWITYFKDLRDQLIFNDSDQLQVECLRFCYSSVIQLDLDGIAQEWNRHRIRKQRNNELPTGKPNVLFHLSNMYGAKDYGKNLDEEMLNTCWNLYTEPPQMFDPHFKELVNLVKPDFAEPTNPDEAYTLYTCLLNLFETYELMN